MLMYLVRNTLIFIVATFLICGQFSCMAQQKPENYSKSKLGLKDAYSSHFPIGVAISQSNLLGEQAVLVKRHFNSLTAENAMKMDVVQAREGVFNFTEADSIVDFAIKNKMKIRGHTLCWHRQAPDWFFVDADGNPASKELVLRRLKTYINAIVTRYKGKIYAWDVVNEAVDDEPKNYLRRSKWYKVLGEDFIAKAFEYAHEADPSALLFYNDYNIEEPDKLETVYRLVKSLKDKRIKIDGIGLQSHWNIYRPNETQLVNAIERFASLGLQVQITELDVSVYPWELEIRDKNANDKEEFTAVMEKKQVEMYKMIFKVFRKYKQVITGVTFWNLSDRYSWLDGYLVRGRKDYPLLFDTQLKPKAAYWSVVNFKVE